MKQPVSFALRAVLSIVLAAFSLQAWGLDCVPTDIYLTSQAEVDAFSVSGCTTVTGNLRISGRGITSIEGLSNLTSVGGGLTIGQTTLGRVSLATLDGLEGLTSVGGGLSILNIASLTNIDGLINLTSLGGGLDIIGNTSLPNLLGLKNLASVEGLHIHGNDSLTSLDGLANLTNMSNALFISSNTSLTSLYGLANLTSVGSLIIQNNASLTDLDVFASLQSVGDHLEILGNDNLSNLDGLSGISVVNGVLYIEGNAKLTSLEGLSSLTSVGGGSSIRDNVALTSLKGLSNLTSVSKDLFIGYNAALNNFDGLTNLTNVGGALSIRNNASLTTLDGLSALTSIGGGLNISNNANLRNVDGLSGISGVFGSLYIDNNAMLASLEGLSNLTSLIWSSYILNNAALTSLKGLSNLASIGGELRIESNNSLTKLDGLTNLTSVGLALNIKFNDSLTSLEGLTNLASVGGELRIWDNDALTRFEGLFNLTNVGGDLFIVNNETLTNVNGLASLISVGGNLYIVNNDALSNVNGLANLLSVGNDLYVQLNQVLDQCAALSRLVDQSDDAEPGPGPGAGGVPDVGGEVVIRENFGRCNSVEEILATVNPFKINPGLNDAWYEPETSGQGFFITVYPDLGYASLAWFTYDTELPPVDATAILGDPGHRWLTALGPIQGNQVLMDIEMTSGGIFDSATEISRTDPPGSDGTILLTFDGCHSGTVEYDIPSINQQGIVPIQRVADDNIALCEALDASSVDDFEPPNINTITRINASPTGLHTFIAIGSDGYPVISFGDQNAGSLGLIKCDGVKCEGPQTTIATIDTQGTWVGWPSAVAIGENGFPIIAYSGNVSIRNSLLIAQCNDLACTGADENLSVADHPDFDVGYGVSIVIGSDGLPIISHTTELDGVGGLRVTKCNDPACSGDDEISTTLQEGILGDATSMAIANDGFPVIANYNHLAHQLIVVKCDDLACTGDGESITVVAEDILGANLSLVLGMDGFPVIAYQGNLGPALKVIKCNDMACAGNDETVSVVDNTGEDPGTYPRIAIGVEGNPIIAYEDRVGGLRQVVVASCNDPACSGNDETITVVDGPSYVGQGISLAIGIDGLPIISYMDSGTNPDSIKVLHCGAANCAQPANHLLINPGFNDAWYDPETSGQGFFITVFPYLGYVSLAWFTYDTELPPIGATAHLGDPGHRWLTALGQIEGNKVLMDIEMTSGGIFDSATEVTRTDPPGSDGTITLTFDSCNSATVEYDIPSINRQGIVPIRRVADDNIALCEALNSN